MPLSTRLQAGTRGGTGTLAVPLAAATMSLAVSAVFIAARPDLARGAGFLFGDEGVNLLVADALNRGRSLYTDIAYPYGPIPIRLYAGIARAFGNAPGSYLGAIALLAAISVAMTAALIQRCAGWRTTLVVVLVGLVPTMPLPGAAVGGYTASLYMPLERICLLAAVLFWEPAPRRSPKRSLVMGGILGLCQGVRFGSGAVCVAAIALFDVLAPPRGGGDDGGRARSTAWLLAGFLLCEAAWGLWAWMTLPRPYALEFLWPLQMWETHQTTGAPRWPTWHGWRMAAVQYAMPVTAAVLGIAGIVRWLRRRGGATASMILVVFFALASVFYFRHEHHFRQFAWTLVAAGAALAPRLTPIARTGVLALCVPALWPIASALLNGAPGEVAAVRVPRNYTLVLAPDMAARVQFLETHAAPGPVVFVPNGAGWLYAYRIEHVSRHAWLFSRAVIRPFEEDAFVASVGAAAAVIRCDQAGTPGPWRLPAAAVAYIERDFVQSISAARCTIRKRAGPAHSTPAEGPAPQGGQ